MGYDTKSGEILMHAGPEQLHATVAMVLARDWPEREIPTLGEIEGFCQQLKMAIDSSYQESLTQFGLQQGEGE